jgi:phosphohistidine phosphatase
VAPSPTSSRARIHERSRRLRGHEPQLSKLISYLIAGNSGLAVTMKKGGLCKLDVPRLRYARAAALEWLLTPSQLAHLAP